jgi:lipopolysaccharide export system permease protein
MTVYDRYLLKNLFVTFAKVLVSLLLIFVVVDVITHRQDNIINYGIPIGIVLRYYLDFSPVVLFQYQVAAVAVLISALMVMGRAAQDNELTACFAGGVGLWRVARAPIFFALLTAIGAFVIEDQWGSKATENAYALESRYFLRASDSHRQGVSWTNLNGEWTCHIMKFNRKALTGQDVYLYSKSPEKVQEVRANRIYWDDASAQWILEDGRWVTFNPQVGWEQEIARITQTPGPFLESPQELFALEHPPETKSAKELLGDLHYAEALNIPVTVQWVSFHGKFARPAVCFLMVFIAIPFAMRVRRGGVAVGFGLSIAIALAYMLLYYAGIGLGYINTLPPFAAAWMANAVFACVAGVLCFRTPS